MLQTQGWRGSARRVQGGSGRAENLLRRSRFSSLLPCPGEDLGGTNQPKFVQTEEEPARPHCQGEGGHPGVPSSSLVCAWLSKRCVSVLLHLHVFKHVRSLWCEMLSGNRTLSAQSHGWGWAVMTDGLRFSRCSFFYSRCSSGAARDTLQN